MTAPLKEIVRYLDDLLNTRSVSDYPGALNGLQFENSGSVSKIAAAVDFSSDAIDAAIESGADLIIVHHGMFWAGVTPIIGATRERIRRLIQHDIAVYSSHLPLDRHPELGNNALLAKELDLQPTHPFASYGGISIGLRGPCDVAADDLINRVRKFSREHGSDIVIAGPVPKRVTSWAICTGAGASAQTIDEAVQNGVEALIVGEGPHWTAVEARERQILILYAGHYATETLGIIALAKNLSSRFSIDWTWIDAPTGL